MPVIVIGADTEVGEAVVDALLPRQGEVRAFVTEAARGAGLKERGAKVAVGDVSDASHVGGASLNAFTAVVIAEAARDGRERAFAADPEAVFAAWAEGLADASVKRAIWVGSDAPPAAVLRAVEDLTVVTTRGRSAARAAEEVAALDDQAHWG